MKPEEYTSSVSIPLTFDGVKRDNSIGKMRVVIAIFAIILAIIFSIYIVFNANATLIVRILYGILFFIASTLLIRIVILKESYFRKQFKLLESQNYQCADTTMFGIYEIGDGDIPICRFQGDLQAVFIKMYRGSIVGCGGNAEYNHFENLADSLYTASKSRLKILYLDVALGSTGSTFLDDAIDSLEDCNSDTLKDMLSRIYDNVCALSKNLLLNEDIFVVFGGNDAQFEHKVSEFADSLLDANYVEYEYLGIEELSDLYSSLMNLPNSNISSLLSKPQVVTNNCFKTIWIERGNDREIVNLTSAELKQKMRFKKAEKEAKLNKSKVKQTENIYFDFSDNPLNYNVEDDIIEENNDDFNNSKFTF